MVEELAQWGGCAGATCLLAVDVVHCAVGPETEGEGVVEPGGIGAIHGGLVDDEEEDVRENAEESKEGDEVWCHPEWEEVDAVIPLKHRCQLVFSLSFEG